MDVFAGGFKFVDGFISGEDWRGNNSVFIGTCGGGGGGNGSCTLYAFLGDFLFGVRFIGKKMSLSLMFFTDLFSVPTNEAVMSIVGMEVLFTLLRRFDFLGETGSWGGEKTRVGFLSLSE